MWICDFEFRKAGAEAPFDFDKEYATALHQEIAPDLIAKVVGWDTLIQMKKEAGRLKDLADVDMLEKIGKLK
jgi:hypothetical protein